MLAKTDQRVTRLLPTGVDMVERSSEMSVLHHADCAAVIWRRPELTALEPWIDALDPMQLPKVRMVLPAHTVREAVHQVCDSCGTPACNERNALVEDISDLAELFSDFMSTRYVRLRLDVVNTNACRKFHVDTVTARLVCTYRGTGTQYGTSQNKADPKRVFTVPTGSPILLRGTRWPEQPSSGLSHRSPPIQGTGETRLLFVLDPVADPYEGL